MRRVLTNDKPAPTAGRGAYRLCAKPLLLAGLAVAGGSVGPQPAAAEEWRLRPVIGVEERYTDNVFSTKTNAESDFITTLTPSFSLSGSGSRVKADINYDLSYDNYAQNSDLNGLRHNLLGVTNTDLWKEHATVDARASVSEQAVSRTGPADSRTQPSNQTRIATYSLTPRLEQRLGDWAAAEALYRHAETKYLQTSVGSASTLPNDSTTDSAKLGLKSSSEFTRWRWSLFGDSSTTQRTSSASLDQSSITGSSDFAINRHLGFLTTLGFEDISDPTIGDNQYGGMFYSAGLRLQPGPRTMLKAEVGRRYDGVYWSGEAQYEMALTSLRAYHREGIRTQSLNYADQLNAVQRDENGNLVNPFTGTEAQPNADMSDLTSDLFKEKETALSFTHRRQRYIWTFSSNLLTRDYVSRGTQEETLGLNLSLNHSFTPKLSGNVAVNYTTTLEAPKGQGSDTRWRTSASLNYQFNPSLSGNFGFNHQTLDSEDARGYSENVISIGLRKEF